MRNIFTITLFSLILFVAACSDGGGNDPIDGREVYFAIEPTITAESPGATISNTRGKIDGTFPAGSNIGLSLYSNTYTLPAFYNNFFAQLNTGVVGVWYYFLNGVNTGNMLSGFSNWGTINVYGYYPYNPMISDIGAIPFNIATMTGVAGEAEGAGADAVTDYMVSNTGTRNMTVTAGPLVSLQFMHLMTAIDLYLTRPAPGAVLTLSSVVYQIDSGRSFTVSGTYNARNPSMSNMASNITPGDTATKMTLSYSSNIPISTFTLVIMPELRQSVLLGDATVTLTFRFLDQDGSHYIFENIPGGDPSVSFKLSDITNPSNDNGLLAGYRYQIMGTIGTYTSFTAPTTGTPMPPHINDDPLVDDPNQHIEEI